MLDLLPDVASLRDYSLGPVWYSLTLALSVPLCLPSPPFEIVGGYIFSPSVAVPASVIGKTCGACFAFLASRNVAKFILRDADGWRNKYLKMLGMEKELRLRPVQTLCIIRASPLPSFVKSYFLGLTDVSVSSFALACVVINTPYSIAWAAAGNSATSLQDASSADAARGIAGRVFIILIVLYGMSVAARRSTALLGDGRGKDET